MRSHSLSVTADGSGNGNATTNFPVYGILTAVRMVASSGTATIALSEVGAFGRTLVTKTGVGTSASLLYPSVQLMDSSGTALTSYAFPAISGDKLKITVTSASNGAVITVDIQVID